MVDRHREVTKSECTLNPPCSLIVLSLILGSLQFSMSSSSSLYALWGSLFAVGGSKNVLVGTLKF